MYNPVVKWHFRLFNITIAKVDMMTNALCHSVSVLTSTFQHAGTYFIWKFTSFRRWLWTSTKIKTKITEYLINKLLNKCAVYTVFYMYLIALWVWGKNK